MQPHPSPQTQNKKLVLTTDVPFWRQQTGAQQRISTLVTFLVQQDWDLNVCFVGSLDELNPPTVSTPQQPLLSDQTRINELPVRFFSLVDDWQPSGWLARINWQFHCIAHRLSSWIRFGGKVGLRDPLHPKTLREFASPAFRKRFQQFIRATRPDVVIVEYITLSYLLPTRAERAGTRYWVDTHDVLSSRYQQCHQAGLPHWIEITETEESAALNQFDGIIAIEPNEAAHFKGLVTSGQTVIVAGHPAPATAVCSVPATGEVELEDKRVAGATGDAVRVGIIASQNEINLQGINWFLAEVWPRVEQHWNGLVVKSAAFEEDSALEQGSIELVVAGSICSLLSRNELPQRVIYLGIIDQVSDFYDQVDIVINPTQLGTGLKIKSIEALGYGKPLIATAQGLSGLARPEHSAEPPWLAIDDAESMAQAIIRLARDRQARRNLSLAAQRYAAMQLSAAHVYRELVMHL